MPVLVAFGLISLVGGLVVISAWNDTTGLYESGKDTKVYKVTEDFGEMTSDTLGGFFAGIDGKIWLGLFAIWWLSDIKASDVRKKIRVRKKKKRYRK